MPATVLAGLKPSVLGGPIDREAYEAYVKEGLVPELRHGDFVVMDNVSSHTGLKGKQELLKPLFLKRKAL